MSPKGFGKRLGFKRSTTEKDPVTVSEQTNDTHGETSSNGASDVRDISEAEANQRLKAFRQEHKWDPNLPDEAVDMVDAATAAHDQNGEAKVVGEVIENSPYPEVSCKNV